MNVVNLKPKQKTAIVISTGWIGDTIACSAAASSLSEKGYQVTFIIKWPQLFDLFFCDHRFKTVVFPFTKSLIKIKKLLAIYYDLIVIEPDSWGYEEPFTCEIRRLAKCEPVPEYFFNGIKYTVREKKKRLTFSVGRDTFFRAYGRNVDNLIEQLEEIVDIVWVGLEAGKSSMRGKNKSILIDVKKIIDSDYYLGVEGGLLWIAGGVGVKTIYFTEHIIQKEKEIKKPLKNILGIKNYFPKKEGQHLALPQNITNDEVIKLIKKFIQ